MRAIVIQPDGCFESVDTDLRLPFLQQSVGGYIESVMSEDQTLTFWCNEEGKLKGMDLNPAATYLWWATALYMMNRDVLVGPVVVTGGIGPNGDTLGLTEEQSTLIEGYLVKSC